MTDEVGSEIREVWREGYENRRGKVRGMTPEEIEEFLERPMLFRLAGVKPNGDPWITVCWHEWRDGYFWLAVREKAAWAEYLNHDPRVAFVIDHERDLEKYMGEGRAEMVEGPNLGLAIELTRTCAERYGMPSDYVEHTLHQPRWVFRIKPDPSTIRTWKGVGWHRRYWVQGTGGPSYEEAMR